MMRILSESTFAMNCALLMTACGATVSLGGGDIPSTGGTTTISENSGGQPSFDSTSGGSSGLRTSPGGIISGYTGIGGAPRAGMIPLAAGQGRPTSIAVDSTSVYWTNFDDGSLMKISIAGGQPVTLASNLTYSAWVALYDNSVYFNGPTLMKMPLTGGTPVVLDTALYNDAFAVGPSGVYGMDNDGTLIRVALDGTSRATVVPSSSLPRAGVSYGIALDAKYVYWTIEQEGYVHKAPLAGGAPVTLAHEHDPGLGIAVDATDVYFGSGWTLMKVSVNGGDTTTLANFPAQGVTLDGDTVYFTDFDGGNVYKVPKSGGDVTTLATGQMQPWGIAVDAYSVYWVNAGSEQGSYPSGSVMKLTPK